MTDGLLILIASALISAGLGVVVGVLLKGTHPTPPPGEEPPSPIAPWFRSPSGKRVTLAFHPDAQYHPRVRIYSPQPGHRAECDCHGEPLEPGREVIWWPNPLARKTHYLCEGHIVFPSINMKREEDE